MYGQIDSLLLDDIQNNKALNQLFTLRNIRYLTLDDSLDLFEDEMHSGMSSHYTEFIRTIQNLNEDPLFLSLGYPLSRKSKLVKAKLEVIRKNENL